ncbi:MAG TPA: SDR family NAD(P)-dependent oxidoreductase, partial [Acetobacteraceae bacterium]
PDNTETVALDVTDSQSVHRLAASIGGRVEIVVNTALHIRPGDRLHPPALVPAREEMEVAYFGLLRLAQHFGPALRARAADGENPACGWVNIISASALAAQPVFAGSSAAHAAALSLAQSLRAALRPIRVVNAFIGPLDDEWHQALPPPKLAPATLAAAVVGALRDGIEELAVGDVAQDILARFRDNPAILARELSS